MGAEFWEWVGHARRVVQQNDTYLHLVISAVLTALVYAGARSLGWRRRTSIGNAVILVGLVGIARELMDAWLGQFIPEKYFSPTDMGMNILGIWIGLSAAVAWGRWRRK